LKLPVAAASTGLRPGSCQTARECASGASQSSQMGVFPT
jgi:hypothetical protein